MEDLQNAGVDMDWTDVEEFCFAQETEWNEIYIPTAVTCIKYPDNSIMQEGEGGIAPATVNATGDDPIEYFEGWLEEQHGSEYSGQPVSSKTQNGTTMHLKSAFQTYVYRNQTFLFSVAVSVAGFITGFLGRIVSATRLATFSFLVGTAGLFTAGSSVDEYILRANWFKYATLGVGTGYPYGLTDKFIHYYGYQYSRSGNFDIDEEAAETSYVPSAEVYNNNSKVYDAAFEEYARIGWQDGNF